jgi:hypothetical protein
LIKAKVPLFNLHDGEILNPVRFSDIFHQTSVLFVIVLLRLRAWRLAIFASNFPEFFSKVTKVVWNGVIFFSDRKR